MSITNVIKNLTIAGTGGGGGGVSPLSLGGQLQGFVDNTTASFPSTTHNYDFVMVNPDISDSSLPFTIQNITFSSKQDRAYYLDGEWRALPAFSNTQSVSIVESASESCSGTATTQQEANIEFTNEIKDLKTRSFRTIGYCGTTQPLQAREDDIFYQTSATSSYGSDLPTNFPIQVYRWNNGAWSADTENWTPDVNDVIINININPPIAFVWQNGWSPTTQGLSTTDNITIDRNNNGELQVKDSGITFLKLDPNAVATQNENSNNKVVRADAMYNTAITKNVSQIKTKTGGGKEIEIDLQNEANVSKTKVNIDLDETATQNSNNPITSNGVWKEELNNTNSTLEYDDTNADKDVINLELKNNNGDTKIDKTIDFNDKIVFEDKTQELFNKTLDFDATSATKNIAENIPLSSLAKQTASDNKKILQVKGSDHHIDLSFLDVIKEVNSIPQTKDDEDILLHLTNDKHLYYWNEDESEYVAVGGGGVVKVNTLPVSDIDSEVIYAVEETNTQVVPTETYIHYWIYDSNLSKWYEIYTDKYGDVVYENKEQTLTGKTIEAEDNNLNIFIDTPTTPVSDVKNTLYWDTTNKALKYRKDNEWKICGEGDIKYVNTLPASNISSKNLYCLTKTKWVYDETDYQTITQYCTDLTTTATGITLYGEAVETAWADLTPAMITGQGNHIWVKTDADNSWQFGYITNLLYDYYTQFEFVIYYEIYCNPTGNVNNYILIASNDNNLIKYYTKTEADKKFLDKQNFLNNLYPKDSVYPTWSYKNPSTFLGGTWVLIGGQDANLNYYPAFAIATDTEGTTISESLPTITGSYRVGGNLPLTNIKTSGTTSPTTADGCFSITEEQTPVMLNISSGTSVKPKALNFDASNSSPIYKNNAHVNVNAIKIFFWRRTDDAPVVFNAGNITMDTTLSPQSTDDHIPTSKAVVGYTNDNFASIGTSKYVGTFKTPDNCIVPFGFHVVLNMANESATIEGSFVSQMTDPVDGSSNLFGDLKVRQQCYGGSVAGTATNICIEQTFITYLRGSPTQRKVFFRRGYLANSATNIDINNVEAIKNSLTWMSWYPVEYPMITLTKKDTATMITTFDVKACVSGGTCFINVRHINSNANLDRNSSIVIGNCPFCNFRKENALYFGTLYSFHNTEVAPGAIQAISGGELEGFGLKAGVRYIGTASFPLGY